jgi:hypothetical protein
VFAIHGCDVGLEVGEEGAAAQHRGPLLVRTSGLVKKSTFRSAPYIRKGRAQKDDSGARYEATPVRVAMLHRVVTGMAQPVTCATHIEAANPASTLMVRRQRELPRARWRDRTKQTQMAAAATWAQNSWGSSILAAAGTLETRALTGVMRWQPQAQRL